MTDFYVNTETEYMQHRHFKFEQLFVHGQVFKESNTFESSAENSNICYISLS